MSSKRSREERARQRLLAFWECDADFGASIGCVTTTYTLDAAFFEEECLARFAGIENSAREDDRAYMLEREEKLSQVFACVMVDRSHVAPHRSLRWNLLPARIPGGGVMHAKVTLLVWEHRIRVLVGSANLTEPGYRRNYEHLGALDFTPGGELPLDLLWAVLDFLIRLRGTAPGAESVGEEGPQATLTRFLRETRTRAESWESGTWRSSEPRVVFLRVFPNQSTLFEQLREVFPSRTGPDVAWVVSPFYDENGQVRRVVDALVSIMGVRGDRELHFIAAGRELPDEARTIELDLPGVLRKPWRPRCIHSFYVVAGADEEKELRSLHAKSLWLQREDRALFLIGSTNFTAAGTGVAGPRANVEADLAYILPNATASFAKLCEAAYPPTKRWISKSGRSVSCCRQEIARQR